MKFVLNKRFCGRRVVFVVVLRPERRRLRAVAPSSMAAATALYGLRRLGRRSRVSAGEAADGLPGVVGISGGERPTPGLPPRCPSGGKIGSDPFRN